MEKIDESLAEWHRVMLGQKYAADATIAEWQKWSAFLASKYQLKGGDVIDEKGVIVREEIAEESAGESA